MVRSLLLIANPAASRFTGGLHRSVVSKLSRSYELDAVWPTSGAEVETRALEAAHAGVDVIVAMGGDGVVHHVVNGIVGTRTVLGIIPAGTTNVLARILGVPRRPGAAATYLASRPPPIHASLARLDMENEHRSSIRYATFATGIGFDAEVVRVSNMEPYRKYWFGGVHYASSAVSVVMARETRRPPNLRVTDGRRNLDAAAVLVQIHNLYTYFGKVPLRIVPEHPRGLAALLIERLTLVRAPLILSAALAGRKLDKIPGVHVWEDVDEIEVVADPPSSIQADGELLGDTEVVRFAARPHDLRVLAPRAMSGEELGSNRPLGRE